MAGQVIDMMLRVKSDAKGLEAVSKEAKRTSDGLQDVTDDAEKAGKAFERLGDRAGDTAKDMRQATVSLDQFEHGAGEASSIAGGLASGLDLISPAAGGAVRALGDTAGAFEMVGRAGAGLAGPLALVTIAVTAGVKVFEHFNEKQRKAQEEMEATRAAANALKIAMGQWDLSQAENQIANLAASGKITNREMAEYNAFQKATAAAAEVEAEAQERYAKATQDRLNAEQAKRDELAKGGYISSKRLEEIEAQRQKAFEAQSQAASDLGEIQRKVVADAELMMDTFDKVQQKAEADSKAQTAGSGGGGGRSTKGLSEFEKLMTKADALSAGTATRLDKLNQMLAELQKATAGDEAAAALLQRRIKQVTAARDAEQQAIDAKKQEAQATAIAAAQAKTDALTASIDSLVGAYEEPISAADKLRARRGVLLKNFEAIEKAAEKAGVTGSVEFQEMATNFEKQMGRIQSAINALEPPDPQTFAQKLGAGLAGVGNFLTAGGGAAGGGAMGALGGAVDVMASGGAAALTAAAGPAGAAVGGLMQLGQQGAAAYDAEVQRKAQEAAAKRQQDMAAQAQRMKDQGFSDAQIEEAGFGGDAIAKAGEVTGADIAKAETETDRGEMMGEVVQQAVQGLIEGIRSIIIGLPDILEVLIPALLTELPAALITASLRTIPKLVTAIFVKIPKALYDGVSRAFNAIWRAIQRFFADIFDFGLFQSGGFVPSTGRYILHQGERVVPASGASTGTAEQGLAAFSGGSKSNINIHAAVVDPDTVPALGRMIDKTLGAYGRGTVPVFGTVEPVGEI